ncbi:hypothetical protein HNR74_003629 [Flammeovirga kamogawensis]|nr:hypothetical protein [Flammeovirga kamogawensis]
MTFSKLLFTFAVVFLSFTLLPIIKSIAFLIQGFGLVISWVFINTLAIVIGIYFWTKKVFQTSTKNKTEISYL